MWSYIENNPGWLLLLHDLHWRSLTIHQSRAFEDQEQSRGETDGTNWACWSRDRWIISEAMMVINTPLDNLQSTWNQNIIHYEFTNPDTSQENSITKCANHTLVHAIRMMLSKSSLSRNFWGYAILYTAHILNRVINWGVSTEKTPYHLYIGSRPSITYLRSFGVELRSYLLAWRTNWLSIWSKEFS